MKCRNRQNPVIAAVGAWWVSNVAVVAKAVHYACAAHKDERNGFPYTAAMEWHKAAELFAANTRAAEYCWQQWERIIHLPRQLAGPISDSRPVLLIEPISAMQPRMEPSNHDTFLPTASVIGGPAREASFIFFAPPATIPPLNLLAPATRGR
jgi:hypothetical protein